MGGGAREEENKIFVGGLAREVTRRQFEHAFSRFGKILDSLIMLERDTGRPRGFGFITFADRRGMENAIKEMHGREFGDRVISVNRAEPKMGDTTDHSYRRGYPSGGRGNYGGGDRPTGKDECFKCGRPGHWARDCSSGGGRGRAGGPLSSRSRFGESGVRGDRLGGDRGRYTDDRYGGRHGDRDHYKDQYIDAHYGGRGAHDRYVSDRYPPVGDRYTGDRYGGSDLYAQNGFEKDRGYDREGAHGGGRYGDGGPSRNEGRSYRDRLGPYDRPSKGRRPSSYD